jgi:hypothetical protein
MPDAEHAPPTAGVFGSTNGTSTAAMPLTPGDVLEAARVNLVALMRDGIPPRTYVPGCRGMLVASKRHHVAAERKTGKSLAFGVVQAVNTIEAGGTVVVLDRENGADEYARRLDDVLKARSASPELIAAVEERFRYYAWPNMNLAWGKNAAYPEAFAGVDLVIFDSSRKFLTNVGLKEDLSDDYSRFTDDLIDPLSRNGIAVLILDNTGHDAKDRARGSSAKGDLADITFTLKMKADFNRDQAGRLELACRESRFGDVHGTWTMELGGGAYGYWERPEEDGREVFRLALIDVLLEQAPLGRDRLLKAARAKGAAGTEEVLRSWLSDLASDPTSGIQRTSQGYVPEGWTESPSTPVHPPDDSAVQPTSDDPDSHTDSPLDESAVHPSSTPKGVPLDGPPRRERTTGGGRPTEPETTPLPPGFEEGIAAWKPPVRETTDDDEDERRDLQ